MGQWRRNPPTSTEPTPNNKPNQQVNPRQVANNVIQGAGQWNDQAHNWANDAINYAQNNPQSQQANDWTSKVLAGDISTNPFMQNVMDKTQSSNLDETNQMLRNLIGNTEGQGNGGYTQPVGHVANAANVTYGGQPLATAANGGGGGNVPDTVGGSNSFFAQHIRDLFDPSRLDPEHNPGFAASLDAIRKQNQKTLMSNIADLQAKQEASGRYGGGMTLAQTDFARQGAQDSLDSQSAQMIMDSYNRALQDQMSGLGLTNQRDIAAMNDATQRYGIDSSASAASAGLAAQMDAAEKARQLQAIGMMQNNAQFGIGQQGNMAQLFQGAQLGGLGLQQGYAQLGLGGYNTAINAGQLGLGALGLQGNVAQGIANHDLAASGQRFNQNMAQQQAQQDALDSYFRMIQGIGNMGGSVYTTDPGQILPGGVNPWAAGLMGGVGGYYAAAGQGQGGQQ